MEYKKQNQKPAAVKLPCGCRHDCGCGTIPGIENNIPYKGNAVLNAQKS